MKAVRFHTTGGPEVLTYEDLPNPVINDNEVLIRVEAAGVNFADVMRRRGDPYPIPSPAPFILGSEVAGVIEAVGNAVTSLSVGMNVVATQDHGGYAQYIAAPEASVIPLPPGIEPAQAAALVANGLTAALALRQTGRLAEGESVLIESAAGGVGYFAVQLAKLYGAGKVIAATSTPEKRAFVESLGADASVDYTHPGWAEEVRELTGGRGVDVVLEMAGGPSVNQALDAMAPFGRMVFLGQSSGKSATVDPWRLTATNHSINGFYIGGFLGQPEVVTAALTEIIGFLLSGKLKLHVGTVLPLSQAAEAHRLLEGRKTTGKVVLQPWAEGK